MEVIIPQEDKKKLHPLVIFKQGLSLCLKNLKVFSGPYFAVYIPVLILSLFSQQLPDTDKMNLLQTSLGFLSVILNCWGSVVIIKAASIISDGAMPDFNASFKSSGKNFLSYLGSAAILLATLIAIILGSLVISSLAGRIFWPVNKLLALLLIFISTVAAVAAVVYLSFRWALYGIVCVLENSGPIRSLKRSMEILRDYITPFSGALALLVLAVIVSLIPLFVVTFFLYDKTTINVIGSVYNTLAGLLIMPLWILVLMGFYKEAKKE